MVEDPYAAQVDAASSLTIVYWRPGCGFCTRLLRDLSELGLGHQRVNIHEDSAGAVFVRGVAGGNETVPTVRVGDMALINPTVDDVVGQLAEVDPRLVPEGYEPRRPGPVGRWLRRWVHGG